MPQIPELEAHKDEHLMAQMLKKAGEIGLLGGGIPEAYGGSGLDKISAAILAEKLAGYGSFAVSHGGHSGIGTVPIVYFGTEEQKKKYLPKIATGELLSCYCLSEPQAGSDSHGLAHPRGSLARRQELHSERPENVDHQRRIRRRLRRLRQN